jgi:hypothetical protein
MSPVERSQFRDLLTQVARLEARLRTVAGGGVSTRGGSIDVRTTQLGFPAELTAEWDDDRGYAWKRLRLAGVETDNPAIQPTGDHAVTPDDDRTLEPGARGWMEPGPDANGYYFLTAGADEPAGTRGDCTSCAWLADVFMGDEDSGPPCLLLKMRGGGGRCGCMNDLEDNPDDDSGRLMMYDVQLGGWLAVDGRDHAGDPTGSGMIETCCGCGSALFKITSPAALTATLTFGGVHTSCDADDLYEGSGPGPVFTLNLIQECCGVGKSGRPYVSFWGKGPDACDEDRGPCDNTFHVTVECGADCPAPSCGCEHCTECYGGQTPVAYRALGLSGFADDTLNGDWIWTHDPEAACTWRARCDAGSGAAVESVIEKLGRGNPAWRLTHGGAVYESADSSCCIAVTLTRVSGGGPDEVVAELAVPCDPDLDCFDFPNLTATVTVEGCGVVAFTLAYVENEESYSDSHALGPCACPDSPAELWTMTIACSPPAAWTLGLGAPTGSSVLAPLEVHSLVPFYATTSGQVLCPLLAHNVTVVITE